MEEKDLELISKVNNTFIMLLNGIMLDNLDRVKHKISTNIYNYYKTYIEDLKNKGLRQIYEEANIKDTKVIKRQQFSNYEEVKVHLTSRYIDYQINLFDSSYVSGNKNNRVTKEYYLTLTKKNNTSEELIKRCPNCNANIDFNNNGICSYCNSIYDTKNHDYILTEINGIK